MIFELVLLICIIANTTIDMKEQSANTQVEFRNYSAFFSVAMPLDWSSRDTHDAGKKTLIGEICNRRKLLRPRKLLQHVWQNH